MNFFTIWTTFAGHFSRNLFTEPSGAGNVRNAIPSRKVPYFVVRKINERKRSVARMLQTWHRFRTISNPIYRRVSRSAKLSETFPGVGKDNRRQPTRLRLCTIFRCFQPGTPGPGPPRRRTNCSGPPSAMWPWQTRNIGILVAAETTRGRNQQGQQRASYPPIILRVCHSIQSGWVLAGDQLGSFDPVLIRIRQTTTHS